MSNDPVRQPLTPPFVGRRQEQQLLTDALESAMQGSGQLMLVFGEPGIGKSRLAEVLETFAVSKGVRVFWGHCLEWEGTPAYWPWIEVVRDLVEQQPATTAGPGTSGLDALLRQIDPQFPETGPADSEATSMNPEQARFRLLDSLARHLQLSARQEPMVIILEDLHWADRASLDVLEFVARNLAAESMLIVGTVREFEIRQNRALATSFQMLVRVRSATRLDVLPLQRSEVVELIEAMAGRLPADREIDSVFATTEGNPFFVKEVVRLLMLQPSDGSSAAVAERSFAIPDSVREVIAQRLDRLTELTREVLGVAAVIGKEFSLAILERATEFESNDLFHALDEAQAAQIIEASEKSDRYRFRHALLRETSYDVMSSARRALVHGAAGEAIEHVYSSLLTSHYGELARHFHLARDERFRERAISYALLAGDQAMDQVAWWSAVGHYQRAADLLDIQPDTELERFVGTLIKLAEAQGRAGISRGQIGGAGTDRVSRQTYWRAAEVARDASLPELQARAALGASGLNPSGGAGIEQLRVMLDALKALPETDTALRSRLLARLGMDAFYQKCGGWHELDGLPLLENSRRWSSEALAIARRLEDPSATAFALITQPKLITGEPGELDVHLDNASEAIDAAMRANDPIMQAFGVIQKIGFRYERGDVEQAGRHIEELRDQATALKLPLIDWHVAVFDAGNSLRTGEYQGAERHLALADRFWPNSLVASAQRFTLLREQGLPLRQPGEIMTSLAQRLVPFLPFRLIYLLESGDKSQAAAELRGEAFEAAVQLPPIMGWIRLRTLLAELCVELEYREGAAIIYDTLAPFSTHNIGDGHHDHTGGSVAYYLGLLATLPGNWEEADAYFEQALKRNEAWGYRPYAAYTRYGWSEMLLRRGQPRDRERAIGMLAEASVTAVEIGMVRLQRLIDAARKRHSVRSQPESTGLSRRELDVLRLLVDGKTDREIADELFISSRTVMHHVANILRKLDVDSRGAAAVHAVRSELV